MARRTYSVVAISVNSLPRLIAAPWCSINECELSLAIYTFKVKIFRGSRVSTKIFYLEFFINEIFSVKKIPNYGI